MSFICAAFPLILIPVKTITPQSPATDHHRPADPSRSSHSLDPAGHLSPHSGSARPTHGRVQRHGAGAHARPYTPGGGSIRFSFAPGRRRAVHELRGAFNDPNLAMPATDGMLMRTPCEDSNASDASYTRYLRLARPVSVAGHFAPVAESAGWQPERVNASGGVNSRQANESPAGVKPTGAAGSNPAGSILTPTRSRSGSPPGRLHFVPRPN